MFGNAAFEHGGAKLARHGILMQVITGNAAGAGMGAKGGGCKDILPRPLVGGIRVFAQQGLRYVDITRADSKILKVLFAGRGKVGLQC